MLVIDFGVHDAQHLRRRAGPTTKPAFRTLRAAQQEGPGHRLPGNEAVPPLPPPPGPALAHRQLVAKGPQGEAHVVPAEVPQAAEGVAVPAHAGA